MLHQETDGIATFPAAKTFIDFFSRGNSEGRSFLIVEGTKSKIIGSPLFQPDKTSDNLNDVYPADDLLYGILGNQT